MDIQFYANGLYDPSQSGTDSSQPDGFATLALLFNNYIVNSCRVSAKLVNREDFAVNLALGFYPGTKTIGSAAEAIDVGESPFGVAKIISAKGGFDQRIINKKVKMVELWNKRYYYGDGVFQATTSSNPTALAVIVLAAVAPAGSTFENGVSCEFDLLWDVSFSGRKGTDQVTFETGSDPVNTTKYEVFPRREIIASKNLSPPAGVLQQVRKR